MFSKKLDLYLNVVLFCLASYVNAEQDVSDNNLDLAQDECVQEQPSDVEMNSVHSCKIHRYDSPELKNLNLVDILREVWKDGGFDCDEVLSGADKIKSCECTITIENCGCCVIDMCTEHRIRLDDLIAAALNSVDENKNNETTCADDFDVKIDSENIQCVDDNDAMFGACECGDSDQVKNSDCSEVKAGGMYFSSGTIGICDVNFDEDMSNLEPDGLEEHSDPFINVGVIYFPSGTVGSCAETNLNDIDLSNL